MPINIMDHMDAINRLRNVASLTVRLRSRVGAPVPVDAARCAGLSLEELILTQRRAVKRLQSVRTRQRVARLKRQLAYVNVQLRDKAPVPSYYEPYLEELVIGSDATIARDAISMEQQLQRKAFNRLNRPPQKNPFMEELDPVDTAGDDEEDHSLPEVHARLRILQEYGQVWRLQRAKRRSRLGQRIAADHPFLSPLILAARSRQPRRDGVTKM